MSEEEDFEREMRAMIEAQRPRLDAEEREVEALGRRIGFGRLMQAAEAVWRRVGVVPGSEHTVGPCASMMERCPHLADPGPNPAWFTGPHCDWCCGAGRVTKRVAQAMRALAPMDEEPPPA